MSALWHLLVVQVSRSSFCCDGTGRRDAACEALLRTAWWFSHRSPTLDHEILMQRQEAVALSIRAPETLSSLSIHMKNVKDVRPAFKRLPGTASCQDWKTILASLEACIALVMNVRQLPRIAELRIFHRMLQLEEIQALTYMRNAIKETIDFQEFETTKEFSVQHGVSPKLDKQVELYAGLEDFLVVVAREEMDSFPGIESLSVFYLPQQGFFLRMPHDADKLSYVSERHKDIEWIFETTEFCYCKSPRMRELDQLIGDIHGIIRDHCNGVAEELSGYLRCRLRGLIDTIDMVGNTKGQTSRCISEHSSFRIRLGWHRSSMERCGRRHRATPSSNILSTHPSSPLNLPERTQTNHSKPDELKMKPYGARHLVPPGEEKL